MIKNQTNQNKILVLALVIASFLLGMLFTKVQYLEKKSTPNPSSNPSGVGQQGIGQATAGKIKEVTDKDHIRGNKDAKITLVEYSDLECPFCKRFHPTMKELMKTYGDKIRWVYRHFPLSFHANAEKEAEATECVNELAGNDKMWEYIDKIFDKTTSNGTGFALDQLGPLAAEMGLDQSALQTCLDSGKYTQHVKDDIADGTIGGVGGTPSTFIIDAKGKTQLLVGAQPIGVFKTIIDQQLAK